MLERALQTNPTGTIGEKWNRVPSDTVYDIADTEEGLKVKEMIGDKVEVRGTLMDDEGAKEITVESFNIVN
jgi:hypothetical protein